jgi:thiamine biosynthesis lipoprotein
MGCSWRVCVTAEDAGAARRAVAAARSWARQLEGLLSRFREDSELSRLNRRSGASVRVHPVLWHALRWALWASRRTGGLYDPTVLDRLEAAGYRTSFEQAPVVDHLPEPDPGGFGRWRLVRVHPSAPVVTLPPGLRLDLGGVGKAFAAECVAEGLRRFGACAVDAGGDVAVRGAPPGWPGWPISVESPWGSLGAAWLRRGGVATSGTDVRRWPAGQEVAHHIVDPRTGLPARTDVACVTVFGRHAVEANAHALAAVVLGRRQALPYLCRRRLRAAVVAQEGTVQLCRLVLHPLSQAGSEEVD